MNTNTVNVRTRDGAVHGAVSLDKLLQDFAENVNPSNKAQQ